MAKNKKTREEIVAKKHILSWRKEEMHIFMAGARDLAEMAREISTEKQNEILLQTFEILEALLEAEEEGYQPEKCEKYTKDMNKRQCSQFEALRATAYTAYERYINGGMNIGGKKDEDDDEEEQNEIKEIESLQREADKRNSAAIRAVYRKKIEKIDTMTVPELQTIIKAMRLTLKTDFQTINTIIEELPKIYQGMTIAEALQTYAESEEAENMNHIERPF